SVKVSVTVAAMNDAIRAAKCRNELFALRSSFRNLSAMAKMALGKGLSALIAAQPAPAPAVAALPDDHSEKIWQISLDNITPSPLQPRKEFGTDALSEVGESIRQ